jgi:hypothetical protein
MTAHTPTQKGTTMLHPVKPGQVRHALFNAFTRHGITPSTAESIWYDLTTGNDPRPDTLPETFTFKGVTLVWPGGRHTRVIRPQEYMVLNRALRASTYTDEGVEIKAALLDGDDTAEIARNAYRFLWHRTQQPGFDNTTVVEDKIAEVVAEATRESVQSDPDVNDTLNLAVARMTITNAEPEGEHPCRKTKTVHEPHPYMRARKLTQCPGITAPDTAADVTAEVDQLLADLDLLG